MLIKNFFFCLILLFLWSCNSDVQPKPEAYLRLKYEKLNYKAAKKHPNLCRDNTLAELKINKNKSPQLIYPKMKATLYMNYNSVRKT